jgi:hypothetical protein
MLNITPLSETRYKAGVNVLSYYTEVTEKSSMNECPPHIPQAITVPFKHTPLHSSPLVRPLHLNNYC